MANLNVAKTILTQLGGSRFTTMTGAKDLVGGDNYLMFRLPRNFAKDGINKVQITLDPTDTYTVKFLKCDFRKHTFSTVREITHVLADNLQPLFTAFTGLDTHL